MIDNEILVKRIQQGKNVNDNMMQLYNQNKGILYKSLRHYKGYDNIIDKNDLMQEAYIYLYDAVSRYNANKGIKFITYLTNSMKWKVGRDMRNKRIIRIPEYLNESIVKYMNFREKYIKEYSKTPTDKEVIDELKMPKKRLQSIKKAVKILDVESMERQIAEDLTISDMIRDHNNAIQNIEDNYDREILSSKFWKEINEILTESQIQILELRYVNNWTLQRCSEYLGISKQAVNESERNSFRKIRGNYKILRLARQEMQL